MVRLGLSSSIFLSVFAQARGDLLALAAERGEHCKRTAKGTVGLNAECLGAPDQMNMICPRSDSSLKTKHVNAAMKIGFNNTSGEEVSMYWLDDTGKEVFQRTISVGQAIPQDTFLGHVFRFRDSKGRTLLEHTVGFIPLRNDAKIRDFPTDNSSHPNPELDEERVTHEKNLDEGFEVGFINRAGGFLKVFFYRPEDGQRELITQLENDDVYPQYTYTGHQFRAYTSDDRLVTSVRIGNIVIPSCKDHHQIHKAPNQHHAQRLIATSVGDFEVWDDLHRDRSDHAIDPENMFECFSTYCTMRTPQVLRRGGFLARMDDVATEV